MCAALTDGLYMGSKKILDIEYFNIAGDLMCDPSV